MYWYSDIIPILAPLALLLMGLFFILFVKYPRLALFLYICTLPLFEVYISLSFARMRLDDMLAVLGLLAAVSRHGLRPITSLDQRSRNLLKIYVFNIVLLCISAAYGYILYSRLNVYDTGRMLGNFVKTMFLVLTIRDRDDFVFVLKTYVVIFFITGIYYYIPITRQLQWEIDSRYQAKRTLGARDMGINANTYGYYLSIGIMFTLLLRDQLHDSLSRSRVFILWGIFAFFTVILASLFFRAALIAAMVVFVYRQVSRQKAGLIFGVMILIIAAMSSANYIFQYLQTFDVSDIGNRSQRFIEGIMAWREHPIFGHGFGQEYWLISHSTSHNSISASLCETGLIGFGFMLTTLVTLLVNLKDVVNKHEPLKLPFALGIGLLVLMSPTPSMWIDKTSMLLMGILLTYIVVCRREEQSRGNS